MNLTLTRHAITWTGSTCSAEIFLVAPVVSENKSVKYYARRNLDRTYQQRKNPGRKMAGRSARLFPASACNAPNSLIAIGSIENRPDYDYAENVTFHLFELQDGHRAESVVYNTGGSVELEVSVTRKGNLLHIAATGNDKAWKPLLRNIRVVQPSGDFAVSADKHGTKIIPAKNIGGFSAAFW